MATATSAPPLVLIAAAHEHSVLASVFEGNRYAVVQVHTGTLALESARELRPDTIILEAALPDMSGIDVCRLLHADVRIGHNVPILILAPDKPTPEERVTALRAGAWDFLRHPEDPQELALKLQTYVHAKRNIDDASSGTIADATTALLSRPALARRARELGALMNRTHGALACIVFALETNGGDPKAGSVLVRTARICDVVGILSPTEFAILAPRTDHAGVMKLVQRVADALTKANVGGGTLTPGTTLRAGYDAVENLKYAPTDAVELLGRASAAVRHGKPEPSRPWVRRFDGGRPSGPQGSPKPHAVSSQLVFDRGKASV
jgi:DNA-binding response OmpR family regulator